MGETWVPGLMPRGFDLVVLGWSPGICISDRFLGDADSASLDWCFENHCSKAQLLTSALSLRPLKNRCCWDLPVIQWLRLRASNAGGAGSSPGLGTKSPQAVVY